MLVFWLALDLFGSEPPVALPFIVFGENRVRAVGPENRVWSVKP